MGAKDLDANHITTTIMQNRHRIKTHRRTTTFCATIRYLLLVYLNKAVPIRIIIIATKNFNYLWHLRNLASWRKTNSTYAYLHKKLNLQ